MKMNAAITREIKNYVADYDSKENIWGIPMVSFASADDPLFVELKSLVGKPHFLPSEILADAKTVVVYFIPFKREIAKSNVDGTHCSRGWAEAYIETNKLIDDINCHFSEMFAEKGFKAAVRPATHDFDEEKLISNWSHKHAAFIAGLGRFGLHQMIITKKGCCGRLGSFITNAEIEATVRPETEYCLYKHDGSCRKCVDKCAFGALKEDYFDRYKCYDVCLENAALFKELGLSDVCGKCVCSVPCSFKNPVIISKA